MEQGITCYEVLGVRPGASPDARGLFHPVCPGVTRRYGLHVTVVRLTKRPIAVDVLVVDQAPSPAANARRGDALTVQMSHPSARSHRQTMSLPDCPAAQVLSRIASVIDDQDPGLLRDEEAGYLRSFPPPLYCSCFRVSCRRLRE